MSRYDDCLNALLSVADDKGYLTFDNIMDTTDAFELTLSEVDRISEMVHLRGIIVYEVEPLEQSEDELEDYSRVDYNLIFKEIIEICPELDYIVNIVKEIPPPQYKEISLLVAQNADGNGYARERLILLHLRVVLKIALSMSKQYELDLADVVSSGFMGLIVAVDKYDPNGFNAFQSYASLWIQQHIQRECNPWWFELYFPAHYKSTIMTVKQKFEEIYGNIELGMDEDDMISFSRSMSSNLEMKEEQILQCLHRIRNQRHYRLFFDSIVDSLEGEELVCSIVDTNLSPEEYACQNLLKEEIKHALQTLTEREEKILILRYGLIDGRERTLEQVGKEFNLTRERIRQIEAKALKKLKHPTRSKRLKFLLKVCNFILRY